MIGEALKSAGVRLSGNPDDTRYAIEASEQIVRTIMRHADVEPRSADEDDRFVAGVFLFVTSDYVSRFIGGISFETVSSVALVSLFSDHAAGRGALVAEVARAYNKMVLSGEVKPIGERIAGWINDPDNEKLTRLADLFRHSRANIY